MTGLLAYYWPRATDFEKHPCRLFRTERGCISQFLFRFFENSYYFSKDHEKYTTNDSTMLGKEILHPQPQPRALL